MTVKGAVPLGGSGVVLITTFGGSKSIPGWSAGRSNVTDLVISWPAPSVPIKLIVQVISVIRGFKVK